MIDNEHLEKAIWQFQAHALELFSPFTKYGYKELKEGAEKELIILVKQLKQRLNGEDVVIATPRQLFEAEI